MSVRHLVNRIDERTGSGTYENREDLPCLCFSDWLAQAHCFELLLLVWCIDTIVLTDISKDRGNECFHFYFISFFFLHHLQEGLGWKPWLHYYWSGVKAYDLPECSQPQRNADSLPFSWLEACLISLTGRILSNSFHGVAMPQISLWFSGWATEWDTDRTQHGKAGLRP